MNRPPSQRARTIALLSIVSLVSACGHISGLDGRTEYACKAPVGVRCDSVSGNYYNAIKNNLPSQREPRPLEAPSRMQSKATPSIGAHAEPEGRSAQTATPLRSPTRVLRLWFKPWEDSDHDLVDQGFVYVQIDGGRWLIDHAQQRIRDAYAAIRPPRSAGLPGATQGQPAAQGSFQPGALAAPGRLPAPPFKPVSAGTPPNDTRSPHE